MRPGEASVRTRLNRRMMQYLSLHTFDITGPTSTSTRRNPLLQREALRRLAWAVFYVDCMADAGLYGVHTVHENSFQIRLPGHDEAFLRGDSESSNQMAESDVASPMSIFGAGSTTVETPAREGIPFHLVQTMAMRRQILHFHSSSKRMSISIASQNQLDEIQIRLRTLIADLPQSLAYTESNLYIHSAKRTAFVLLHALRHNCFLMLLTARLELFKSNAAAGNVTDAGYTDRIESCLRQRLKHAVPTANIIQDILLLDINCDPYIGSLGYTALESRFRSLWAMMELTTQC